MIKPPNTYYFFIPLFCIYAVIPLFSAIAKEKRKRIFSYIVILVFIINLFIPFFKNTVYYFDTGDYWHIGVCSGYAIYPVLGYLMKEYEWGKKVKIIVYILAVAGLLMHILGTYHLSLKEGHISDIYKGYVNVPCILYSCGVFLLFKDIGNKMMQSSFISKLINFLGKYTFGIYLLHESIYLLLCMPLKSYENLLICRLGLFFIIVPICILIIFLLRKIPVIKYVLP